MEIVFLPSCRFTLAFLLVDTLHPTISEVALGFLDGIEICQGQ